MKFYTSENEDLKAAVVERFNRTLKAKMHRYFTHANTKRYLDVLDDLLYIRIIIHVHIIDRSECHQPQ